MNGREKSDPVIVAVKSPNKTGEPAAEVMERRRGAEENASQQRTRRTQSRESVTPDAGTRTDGRKALPSLSEVGAGCGKAARPDLCGGTGATRFPTAITKLPPAEPATIAAWLRWVFEGSGDLLRCLRKCWHGDRRVAAPGPSE